VHQDFTFALLTDTHISKHNPAPAEDLNKVVTEINNNPKIELLLFQEIYQKKEISHL